MNMRYARRCGLISAALSLFCGCRVHAGDAGSEGPNLVASRAATDLVPDEEYWYIIHLQGQPCGYMASRLQHVGGEVISKNYTKMEIVRGRDTVSMSIDQEQRETPDGHPLSFKTTTWMGDQPQTIEGKVSGGMLTLIEGQYDSRRERSIKWDPQTRFAWGLLLEQRQRGLAPGTSYTTKMYEPNMRADGPIDVEIQVIGPEKRRLGDRELELHKVVTVLKGPLPIPNESWVDDQCRPVLMSMNMGLFKADVILSTRQEALNGARTPPELFLSSFVATSRVIGQDAVSVKLRLRLPDASEQLLPDLPETAMQQVQRIGPREAVVSVRRLDWEALRSIERAADANSDMSEYLRSSRMLATDDELIQKLSARGVRDHARPAEQADALRRLVTVYIDVKDLDVMYATAAEVARTRKGDCTEHAVLLAALARAAGLPSRGVAGLIEIPPRPGAAGGAFGYHMWTQVHVGGKWVDVDAAMRQTDCDPTHIALSIMPLNDEGMLDSMAAILPLLGQLQIEVLEVK